MQKTSVWRPTKESHACKRGRERQYSSELCWYLILEELFHPGGSSLQADSALH